MNPDGPLPEPASRQALAVLRHPDQRTPWIVLLIARLDAPPADLADRVRGLHAAVPLIGARLAEEIWYPGAAPEIVETDQAVRGYEGLLDPIDFSHEAPLRIVVGGDTALAVA